MRHYTSSVQEDGNYREFFVQQFELDQNWENVQDPVSLLKKKQKVCSRHYHAL